MSTHYPILTDTLNARTALMVACYEGRRCPPWKADDPDDYIAQVDYIGRCPTCNSPNVGPQYELADVCANCGKKQIGMPLGRFCSRVCELQGEYAAELAARRTTPTNHNAGPTPEEGTQ